MARQSFRLRHADALMTRSTSPPTPTGCPSARGLPARQRRTRRGGRALVAWTDLFLGYLDALLNADAFTDDGFFRTGDLASIAASGAVTIRGRHKDIIVRGGENISAKEVEDVLFEHPAVSEVAVVAMPDPVMVERSCAFVVPKEGAHRVARRAWRRFSTSTTWPARSIPSESRSSPNSPRPPAARCRNSSFASTSPRS